MKASEFIEDLKVLIAEHGDLPVVNASDDPATIEWNDAGNNDVAYVIE